MVAKRIPNSQQIPAPVLRAFVWLREYVDTAIAAGGGGGGVTDHGLLTGLGDDDHAQYHTDARGDARYTLRANNLSDVSSTSTARTNLGLGTAATLNVAATGDAAVGEVVKGNDTRLTNSRTPSAHAASHANGGSDALTVTKSMLSTTAGELGGQWTVWNTTTFTNVTGGTIAGAYLQVGKSLFFRISFTAGTVTGAGTIAVSLPVLGSAVARTLYSAVNNATVISSYSAAAGTTIIISNSATNLATNFTAGGSITNITVNGVLNLA